MLKIKMKSKKNWKIIGSLCLVLLIISLYNGLITTTYPFYTDHLKAGESMKVILITDLHSHEHGKDQSKLIQRIKREKPDLIALSGDIVDDKEDIKGAIAFFEQIKGTVPTFYVTGNHEHRTDQVPAIKALISQYGVVVLDGSHPSEMLVIKGIDVALSGIDDPYGHEEGTEGFIKTLHDLSLMQNKEVLNILLSHRPEFSEFYGKLNFDLVLSGHAHGGQVRIPWLLKGLLAPNQGWFPKFAGGSYAHNNMVHVVSRGVSFNWILPRIFNPPEVVVIHILPKEKE